MNLHNAIEKVLKESGQPMPPEEIAEQIKVQQLYYKQDGGFPDSNQIRARVRKYPSLFQNIEGYILLVDNYAWSSIIKTYWQLVNTLKGYYPIPDVQFIVAVLFYLKRKNDQGEVAFIHDTSNPYELFEIKKAPFPNRQEEEILYEFREIIQRNSSDFSLIREAFRTISQINTTGFKDPEYGAIFNYLMNLTALDSHQSPTVYTPDSLKQLMARLIYSPDMQEIYDPVAGTGGLLIEAMKLAGDKIGIKGSEVNSKVARLGFMNLSMHGLPYFDYKEEDCFRELNKDSSYDYIIGDLPLSGILNNRSYYELYRKYGFTAPQSGKGFGALILFIISKLSHHGKAVVTVSESFLYKRGKEKEIREYLVNRNYIEAVISLPQGALRPYTESKASLLVINKANAGKPDVKIKFIEAQKIDEDKKSIDLNIEEVLAGYHSTETDKNSYIVDKTQLLPDANLLPANYNPLLTPKLIADESGRLLEELIDIKGGASIEKREMEAQGTIPVVKIENLSKDILDVYLSPRQTFSRTHKTLKYNSYYIQTECILIARIGDNLKATYFKPSEQIPEILLHTGILALVPNPRKHPIQLEYLFYQLRSDFVKEQISQRRQGSVMASISMTSLRKIVIPYVDIASQGIFVATQKANIIAAERGRIEEKIRILGVEEKKAQTESDIVRTLVHQLRPKLYTISSDIRKIQRIMVKHNLQSLQEEILFEEEADGPATPDPTLQEVLVKAANDSQKLSDILTTANKVMSYKISEEDMEPVDLLALFRTHLGEKQREIRTSYTIEATGEPFPLLVHPHSIKEMIDQLLLNAEKHGFAHSSLPAEKRKVRFSIKKNNDRKIAVIDYSNNGKPFLLTREDFIMSFKKGQSSDGSGIGGNYIYRIIQAHQGDIIIKENQKSGFRLTIELPFK